MQVELVWNKQCIVRSIHMQITVFGANGKVGRKVVQLLLDEGYTVAAAIHTDTNYIKHERLSTVECDIKNKDQVSKVLQGSNAVISCLGSWGTPTKDILSTGMKIIIPLMQQHNIQRVISLTGSNVMLSSDPFDVINWLSVICIKIGAGKIYQDGKDHIKLLAQSNLDWTVLRSPVMREQKNSKYELSMKRPRPWATVNRTDVAHALVALLRDQEYSKKSPYIHNL